jgi:hypothetical protein
MPTNVTPRTFCECVNAWSVRGREVQLHTEQPDTTSEIWKRLLDLIDEAAETQAEIFQPRTALASEDWYTLATLPPTIRKLTSVKRMVLYGSSLVRIPPEIGEMEALEEFVPYTSYRLHWFPYEITRCKNLKKSTVSTRALYGNFKHRSPFPDLRTDTAKTALAISQPPACSVCNRPFASTPIHRWISLPVATDVLPLLVYACSPSCIAALPHPPGNYVDHPHRGGRSVEQPPRLF